MTSGGLGGLQYGDDAVAAKLSLDIPAGSEAILKEISRYTGDLSANMQAAARFTGEYMSYLQSFPAIQRQVIDLQREQLQVLQQTATAMNTIQGTQNGFVNAGFGSGYGGSREVQGGAYNAQRLPPGYERFGGVGPPAQQPGNNGNGGNSNSNYQDELTRQSVVRDRVRERDARDEQDERHSRRNGGIGGRPHRPDQDDEEIPEVDDNGRRISRRIRAGGQGVAGGITDIASLVSRGGSNGARMASVARLLGTAANAEGEGGSGLAGMLGKLPGGLGGLGKLAAGAGIAGAVVAGGTMAFNAVQDVGEGVQNLRNQDVKTHSLAGGFGIEKDVRMMALNPLLTNDQSREIIMGAINSGHASGKSYDSAVDFIKKNLIDMNVDVKTSVDLLKSSVDLGKQSISSLSSQMLGVQALGATGNKTTEQTLGEYTLVKDALAAQGVDAEAAGAGGMFASSLLNGNLPNGKINTLGTKDADGLSPIAKALKSIIGKGDDSIFKKELWQDQGLNSKGVAATDTYAALGADAPKDLYDLWVKKAKEMKWPTFQMYAQQTGLMDALQDHWPEKFSNTLEFWRQNHGTTFDGSNDATNGVTDTHQVQIGGKNASDVPDFKKWSALPQNAGKSHGIYKDWLKAQGDISGVDNSNNPIGRLPDDTLLVDPDGNVVALNKDDPEQARGLGDPNSGWSIMSTSTLGPQDGGDVGGGAMKAGGKPGRMSLQQYQAILDSSAGPTATPSSSTSGPTKTASGGVGGVPFNDGIAPPAASATPTTTPSGLRSGGSALTVPGASYQLNPPTGSNTSHMIDASPWLKRFFNIVPAPGNVPSDPNTLAANSGSGGATKNSGPI